MFLTLNFKFIRIWTKSDIYLIIPQLLPNECHCNLSAFYFYLFNSNIKNKFDDRNWMKISSKCHWIIWCITVEVWYGGGEKIYITTKSWWSQFIFSPSLSLSPLNQLLFFEWRGKKYFFINLRVNMCGKAYGDRESVSIEREKEKIVRLMMKWIQ